MENIVPSRTQTVTKKFRMVLNDDNAIRVIKLNGYYNITEQ